MRQLILTITLLSFVNSEALALSLKDCKLDASQKVESRDEHLFGGHPDDGANTLYERRGYVITYNENLKAPKWAAWHAMKEYRDTPERKGPWSSFRKDAEAETASTEDYVGWYDSKENFARGHIVPFFISGGDRNGNGKDAEYETTLKIEDEDDACTVYEINSMINITPQYHSRFNGNTGIWYTLETDVRRMVDAGQEFWLFAGTIFDETKKIQMIGDRDKTAAEWEIGVPHGLWKLVIHPDRNHAVAFLFDHQGDLLQGCSLDSKWPSHCIVKLDVLEKATGLRFFDLIDGRKKKSLRESSTRDNWLDWLEHSD